MYTIPTTLIIDGESFPLQPDTECGWTMTTADVARAFGVTEADIIALRMKHFGPFVPNIHMVFRFTPDLPQDAPIPTYWTRRGVMLMGELLPGPRAARVLAAASDAWAPYRLPSHYFPADLMARLRVGGRVAASSRPAKGKRRPIAGRNREPGS
jgi:hypothetical protein